MPEGRESVAIALRLKRARELSQALRLAADLGRSQSRVAGEILDPIRDRRHLVGEQLDAVSARCFARAWRRPQAAHQRLQQGREQEQDECHAEELGTRLADLVDEAGDREQTADGGAARAVFLRWIWYAARRAELRLDGVEDGFASAERVEASLRAIAPTLRLSHTDQQLLLPHVRITRYGADETVQFPGQVTTHRPGVAYLHGGQGAAHYMLDETEPDHLYLG